jgi:hypothetical protein
MPAPCIELSLTRSVSSYPQAKQSPPVCRRVKKATEASGKIYRKHFLLREPQALNLCIVHDKSRDGNNCPAQTRLTIDALSETEHNSNQLQALNVSIFGVRSRILSESFSDKPQ